MSIAKRQHYVPQFYLKNFSRYSDNKTLGIFNLLSNRFIPQGKLKKQAYECYFYGNDGLVEEELGKIEGMASRVISNILQIESVPVPFTKEHIILITFLIFLHHRTLFEAELQNEFTDKLIKILLSKDKRLKGNLDKFKVETTEPAVFSLGLAAQILPFTNDLKFKLLVNKTPVPFITSDNPVIYYNQFLEKANLRGGITGAAIKGLEIFAPLSPHCYVIFYDGGVYSVGETNVPVIIVANQSDINALNVLQGVASHQNLYFNHEIDEKYIRNIVKRSVKHKQSVKANGLEYPERRSRDGKLNSLIHFYREDIKIKLRLTFIKTLPKISYDNIKSQAKPVRNIENVRIFEKFWKLVDKGLYNRTEFYAFLQAETLFDDICDFLSDYKF